MRDLAARLSQLVFQARQQQPIHDGIVIIRREFRDDHVYRATLKAYLSHLMVQRQNLEWYIEGGRTRTGKLRPPRLGTRRRDRQP